MVESDDNQKELVAVHTNRRLLLVSSNGNLQTNGASPRYSSPFSSALQMLKSVINYVNPAEIQYMLSNAAITYVTTYCITGIANSEFGFFAVGGNAPTNLLEAANNQTSLRF